MAGGGVWGVLGDHMVFRGEQSGLTKLKEGIIENLLLMREGVVRILQSLIAGKGGGKSGKFNFDTTNIPPLPPNQPKTIIMTNTDRSFTFTRI